MRREDTRFGTTGSGGWLSPPAPRLLSRNHQVVLRRCGGCSAGTWLALVKCHASQNCYETTACSPS